MLLGLRRLWTEPAPDQPLCGILRFAGGFHGRPVSPMGISILGKSGLVSCVFHHALHPLHSLHSPPFRRPAAPYRLRHSPLYSTHWITAEFPRPHFFCAAVLQPAGSNRSRLLQKASELSADLPTHTFDRQNCMRPPPIDCTKVQTDCSRRPFDCIRPPDTWNTKRRDLLGLPPLRNSSNASSADLHTVQPKFVSTRPPVAFEATVRITELKAKKNAQDQK